MEPSSTAAAPADDEDRAYADAWDEPEASADGTQEQESDGEEPPAAPAETSTQEPPPEETATPETDADPAPTTDDVERVRQELKSWQGRRKKAQEEAEAEERRLAALKAPPTPAESPSASPATFDLSDAERQAIAALEADYGDISPGVHALAKRMAGELVSTQLPRLVESQVRPLREYNEQAQAQAHGAAIQARHPDAFEIRPLLDDWINTLPYRDGARYSQVLQQGSAQDVIQMLDTYKQSTANAQTATKREAQLAGSQGVRHRSGGPPKARPDKNDFDAAWDEAPDTD